MASSAWRESGTMMRSPVEPSQESPPAVSRTRPCRTLEGGFTGVLVFVEPLARVKCDQRLPQDVFVAPVHVWPLPRWRPVRRSLGVRGPAPSTTSFPCALFPLSSIKSYRGCR